MVKGALKTFALAVTFVGLIYSVAVAQQEEGGCGTIYDLDSDPGPHVAAKHSSVQHGLDVIDSHYLSNASPILGNGYAQDHTVLGVPVHGGCS
jgi:hypothetical protein